METSSGLCQDCGMVRVNNIGAISAVALAALLLASAAAAVREESFELAKVLVGVVAAIAALGTSAAVGQRLATAGHASGVLLAAVMGVFVGTGAAVGGLLFALVGWRERRWELIQLAGDGDRTAAKDGDGDKPMTFAQKLRGVLTEKVKMVISVGQLTVIVLDENNFRVTFPQQYKRFASYVLYPLTADVFDLANTDCLHQLTFLEKSFLTMAIPTVILSVLRLLAWRTQRLRKAEDGRADRRSAIRTEALRKQRDRYYELMYLFAFTIFVMVCNTIFKVFQRSSFVILCRLQLTTPAFADSMVPTHIVAAPPPPTCVQGFQVRATRRREAAAGERHGCDVLGG